MDIQQYQENPLVDDDNELHLLPELLKMILTKVALMQMYSKDTAKRQSDEFIFSTLASVDFLWWRSMKKYNLRNKILHLSKLYFQRAKMRSSIIRNNRNFLKEVIDPDKIIFQLESYGCLTEDQVTFLTRLRNHKDNNHELLLMLQNFSSHEYSKFIDCLFATNQTPAALILERGGEAVKVNINYGKVRWTREFEMEFIRRLQRTQAENTLIFNDLLTASVKERLNDTIILHAKQNKGIELWFWCKTDTSLNQMKSFSEEDIQEIIQRLIPAHSTLLKSQLIQVDYCLASGFETAYILKVEPMLDNRVSVWLMFEPGLFIISVTSRGDVLVLAIGSGDNELRIITHEGTVKRTISKANRLSRTQSIQEIMPDIVALGYKIGIRFITIMRLDENGTVLRNIEWHGAIVGISSFRYGDLFIGVFEHKNIHGVSSLRSSDNRCVKLQLWSLESKVARDLLTTDAKIMSIHFDADHKQLYMLSRYKLGIYHLQYEDEVYN